MTDELTKSDWGYIRKTSSTSVALVDAVGAETGFTATNSGGWKPEPGAEELALTSTDSAGTDTNSLTKVASFTLKNNEGTKVTFARPNSAVATWQVSTTSLPTDNSTTVVIPENVVVGGTTMIRPTYSISPTTAASTSKCEATPSAQGCRVMEFVYAASTSATVTAFANYAGQVTQIKQWATSPGASSAAATVVAQYAYDDSGRLREEWDPRISPR
ncbi:hypothetical protein [Streptomyces sp. NPDC059743]|uniref:hypothetical protein n=1 Tax=Streptomyces sp. NPDC059743 TaxID=3346928 RepID=UPI00365CC1C6